MVFIKHVSVVSDGRSLLTQTLKCPSLQHHPNSDPHNQLPHSSLFRSLPINHPIFIVPSGEIKPEKFSSGLYSIFLGQSTTQQWSLNELMVPHASRIRYVWDAGNVNIRSRSTYVILKMTNCLRGNECVTAPRGSNIDLHFYLQVPEARRK